MVRKSAAELLASFGKQVHDDGMAAHGVDHEGSNRGREAFVHDILALGLYHKNASCQIEFSLACQTLLDPKHSLQYLAKIQSPMKKFSSEMADSIATHLSRQCKCNCLRHFQSRLLFGLFYFDSPLACPTHRPYSQLAISLSVVSHEVKDCCYFLRFSVTLMNLMGQFEPDYLRALLLMTVSFHQIS